MSFLNPAFLWALPLIGVPILLHFLNRRPPQHLVFSHIKWLKAAHQTMMPKKKLKEILLLTARVLALLFLVLFFARPLFHAGGWFGKKSDEATLILLVDVSASMGVIEDGRPSLENVKTRAKEVLRQLAVGAQVGLISFSDRVEEEVAPTNERSRLVAVLDTLKEKPRPTDVLPALELAYQMLNNRSGGRKSILVLTDAAQNGWSRAVAAGGHMESYDPDVAVIVSDVIGEVANRGIAKATLQLSEEGTLKGQADFIHNKKSTPQNWFLKLNSRVVAQGDATAPTALLEAHLPEGGFFSGQLALTADALAFDDAYYVAGRVPKGFRLLIVDGESGLAPSDAESYYLKSALESPRDPRLGSIRVISQELFKPQNLDGIDVLVLANLGPLGEMESPVLNWVEQGGGLLMTAGSKWLKTPVTPLVSFRSKKIVSQETTLQAPLPGTPFLNALHDLGGFQWTDVRARQYIVLEPEASLKPLLLFSNNDPMLAMKSLGKGTLLCLTSSLDRAWNNMPAKPIFSPVMRELIAALADPYREQTSLMGFVDRPLKIQVPAGVGHVSVSPPEGAVWSGRLSDQKKLEWASPTTPGLYRVKTNNPALDFDFAINIRDIAKESDGTKVKLSELKTVFPKAAVEYIEREKRSAERLLAALQGKDATPVLMVLLLTAFFVETFLAWPLRRAAAVLVLVTVSWHPVAAQSGNQFVYTQLKYNGAWDPYPTAHEQIFDSLKMMTNIPFSPERRIISLDDPALFNAPFLLLKGNGALVFSTDEKKRFKQYLDRGGFIFCDDTLAQSKTAFAASVRSLVEELYPDRSLQKLPQDHALFRSFFLLKQPAGRRIAERYLEGLDLGGQDGGEGRTALVYCPNDLLGAWMRDAIGNYTQSCEPGGEAQRWESFKLTINVIFFSLTGTYKKDAIHQPFIERKLNF